MQFSLAIGILFMKETKGLLPLTVPEYPTKWGYSRFLTAFLD